MKRIRCKVVNFKLEDSLWDLKLECGHLTDRPVKTRRGQMGDSIADLAPSWVYCDTCAVEDRDG